VRSRSSLVLLLGLASCGRLLGIDDLKGPPDGPVQTPDVPGPAVDCKAQRAVYVVAGTGGLAWFTLAWPAPYVITNFDVKFAYDTPSSAKDVTSATGHPLYTRRLGSRALWEGLGADPQPTAFVAGNNETHTQQPQSIALNGGIGLAAAGTVLQAQLQPKLAALAISPAGPYGTATGAPALVSVNNVDGAVAVFHNMVTPDVEQQLRPSAAQLASYLPPGGATVETTLANELAFTANAFRLGLLGTVILPAFNDDPHGAFTNGAPTQRMNNLATMLDAFYRDLSMSSEMSCGRGGSFLSLADNVVMVVLGDTPKNSFDNVGWADGTPGNANVMYLRSNGFTRPGWFGQLQPNLRTSFNPVTGALDPNATAASCTAAAYASVLYAITRGNKGAITPYTTAAFDGAILR